MPSLLDNLSEIASILTLQPSGFITDIDGTISPSSVDPLHIAIPEKNLHYLSRLVPKMALVAILSGRATNEIARLVNISDVKYVGHYGLEWSEGDRFILHPEARQYLSEMRSLAAEIQLLRDIPGVVIQDKGATISLHYRLSKQPEKTRESLINFLNKSPHVKHLQVIEENRVVGIVPPVDYNKGDAIASLILKYRLKSAVFMGDDTADVPAFRAIHAAEANSDFKGVAILVTGSDTPPGIIKEADYTLDGVNETTEFLKWLDENLPLVPNQL